MRPSAAAILHRSTPTATASASTQGRPVAALALLFALSSGCATYKARPIDSVESASTLEARRLDDPVLKAFLERYSSGQAPKGSWDFDRLALAALYYHPDLEVARAGHEVARAAAITAGARPNPSLTLACPAKVPVSTGTPPPREPSRRPIPVPEDRTKEAEGAARGSSSTTSVPSLAVASMRPKTCSGKAAPRASGKTSGSCAA
jgi:hypothetical protein